MPYSQVLPYLINNELVVPMDLKLIVPPYPSGFDVNDRCDFHAKPPEHSAEDCKVLKNRIQGLVDSKAITFTLLGPSINKNPLPSHDGPSVNVVEEVLRLGVEVIIIMINKTTSEEGQSENELSLVSQCWM